MIFIAAMLMIIGNIIMALLIGLIIAGAEATQAVPFMNLLGIAAPAFTAFIVVIFYFVALALTFLNVAILHVFVYMVGGRNGYTNTYKAVVYGSTPSILLAWIPFLNMVFGIWALILQIKGIRILHDMTTGRAVLAVLLPVIIVLVIVVPLYLMGLASGTFPAG